MKNLVFSLVLLSSLCVFAATSNECTGGNFKACREIFNKYGSQTDRAGAVDLFEKACSSQTLRVSCQILSVSKADTMKKMMERLVALVPRPRVHLTRYHGVLGPHYKHRKQIVPKPPELKVVDQEQDNIDPKQLEQKKKNIPWARLLARVFNIDVETCSKCGGNMKIIAAIEDPKVIRKIGFAPWRCSKVTKILFTENTVLDYCA